jgi:hypothetical protein
MALGGQSKGLCSTCNNSPTCDGRKDIKRPVLFCEEFDGSTSPEEESPPVPVVEDEEADPDTVMGLCCNCGNRDFCTLQDTPGGVWHCEEYR